MNSKIRDFISQKNPNTPCLIVDTNYIKEYYDNLSKAMPNTKIYYAIKANPAMPILKLLTSLGCCFDCASINEIKMALLSGASPDRISYGNTIKKEKDIESAYKLGVNLFAFDSDEELQKISRVAPKSKVYCRILTSGEGADWPLSRKFGCEESMAAQLLIKAPTLGLISYGISFHVGSQQNNIGAWNPAISACSRLFKTLSEHGIELKLINLGGGFPSHYTYDIPSITDFTNSIHDSLKLNFGDEIPETIIEPGRSIAGGSGCILTEVVLISKKDLTDNFRWVYLDIGRFTGLSETEGESIRYDIEELIKTNGSCEDCILAGPTCDSVDILYKENPYKLPLTLKIGDKLVINSTGAYTTTYSTVGFNGFSPLEAYYL